MTWASTSYQAAAGSTSSFEPQTPPLSGCATGPLMDGYANAWDVNGNADYDPSYDMPPMIEDPLLVKGATNEAAPLHTYMAPLSLNAAPSLPSPPPSKRIDMRLAQPGSEESKPGYLTPLASYTAETFWYFWYAVISPIDTAGRRVSNFHSTTTAEPFDSEGRPRHAIDAGLQLQPNLPFRQFVFSVLHSTQVSFSVTILALMYTYKYKKIMALGQRLPYKHEVSEAQGFVTGLMLANKYLDDNTYTNTTWAQFLGIPVKDVNEYELDWLDALKFNLYVRPDDFENWRSMLDAHVRSRERDDAIAAMAVADPFSPGVRARSASPPLGYFDHTNGQDASLRKRTAKDAFAADVLHNTGMYEAARLGARKASFVPLPGYPTASTALPTPTPSVLSPTNVGGHASGSSLGRSSSLSRQIARLPNGRRDSSGQDQIATTTMDLRHAAAANSLNNWVYPTPAATEAIQFDKDERWRQAAARQHRLYFLQAAATPQFGPDPRYHKAIPHYVDPSTGYGYTAAAVAAAQYGTQEIMDVDHLANEINLASPTDVAMAQQQQQQQMLMAMQQQPQPAVPSAYIPVAQPVLHPHFHNPQPAQFANAGPPGYAYGAPAWFQPQIQQQQQPPQLQQPQPWVATRHWRAGHASRWSTSSEEGYMNLRLPPICNSVSEWSTPLHVGY